MTNKQRYINAATCQPVDRVPFMIHFGPWGETMKRWQDENGPLPGDCWRKGPEGEEPFGYDEPVLSLTGHVKHFYHPGGPEEIIEETDRTITRRNFLGGVIQFMKGQSAIPHIVKNAVESMEDWERIKKEQLDPNDPTRFPEDWEEKAKELNAMDRPLQMGSYPCGLFGAVRELMGVEDCLMAFYDKPEVVKAIMDDLTDFWLAIYEKIVKDVKIDVIHIWEDMSGKQGSLISPAMIREFMLPNYSRIKQFAIDNDIPVFIVDTDGNCEELVKVMSEAGVNSMMPFEVLAGCDVVAWKPKYPEVSFEGGINKMEIAKGKEAIDKELDRIEPLLSGTGYIPMLDHLIPPEVSWDDYCYYVRELKKRIWGARNIPL